MSMNGIIYLWKNEWWNSGDITLNGKQYADSIIPPVSGWYAFDYEEGGNTNVYLVSAETLPVLENEGTIDPEYISSLGLYASTTPYEIVN